MTLFRCRFEFSEGQEDEEAACVDVNECNTAADRCDENAICYNEAGGYKCNCKAGYQGDGFNCQSESSTIRYSLKISSKFNKQMHLRRIS